MGADFPIMGTRAVASGPIGERIRHRVAALREDRRLTLAQLSERLGELGRPILPSGLSKIENGERRVDVDDLVALALALDTTPNALLLPAEADAGTPAPLTPAFTRDADKAWRWACGDLVWIREGMDEAADRKRAKPYTNPAAVEIEVPHAVWEGPRAAPPEDFYSFVSAMASATRNGTDIRIRVLPPGP